MFIAVINEGFAIAEKEKQKAQMEAFVKLSEPPEPTASWISRLNPYKYIKGRSRVITTENMRPALAVPLGLVNQDHLAASRGYKAHVGSKGQANGTFISSLKRAAIRKDQSTFADHRYPLFEGPNDKLEEDSAIWDVDQRLWV